MKTVRGCSDNTLIVKKSRFLGLCCHAGNEQQALDIIAQRKKQHYDSSHNCYAYVLENGLMRYSDDGEPQGTAGLPMLEVIKKSGLSDVLVISTRYFGGTLLGAGGLVRAYTRNAADSIEAAVKIEVIECAAFDCELDYNTWAKAEKLLHDAGFMINDINFTDRVKLQLGAMPGCEDALEKLVTSVSLGRTLLIPTGIIKKEVVL